MVFAGVLGSWGARLPATPVYSSDKMICVRSSVKQGGYRSPVLVFCGRVRDDLQRLTRLKLTHSKHVMVEVVVGDFTDGRRSVIATQHRSVDGRIIERIELPDPEAADLDELQLVLCAALLRSWMAGVAASEGSYMGYKVPQWVVSGLAHRLGGDTRQSDIDRTLRLWSAAGLPPAGELFAFESTLIREGAVAAVAVGWLLERRPAGAPLELLLREAADGMEWRVARVAELLTDDSDLRNFDAAFDLWLLAVRRQVFQAGVTTVEIVRRFRQGLLLYPGDYGMSVDSKRPWLTLHEAAARSGELEVRMAARDMVHTIHTLAAGRDASLLAVSRAYEDFLVALARGERPGELTRLLMVAEGMRQELEEQVELGGVLVQPPQMIYEQGER